MSVIIKKYFTEIETDGIDFTNGVSVDYIEKLDDLNNWTINVFQLKEDKPLIQWYVSKNNKEVQHCELECKNVIDLVFYQGHYFLIKKLRVFFQDDKHQQNKPYFCEFLWMLLLL